MVTHKKISTKFNNWIHPFFVRYVMRSYNRKSKKVERRHPNLFKTVPSDLLLRHKTLWESLGLNCSGRWLRFHVNLTGIQDYRFCPEDIFFARIERILNDCSVAGYQFDDKNLLSKFIDRRNLPVTVVRYINGLFLDEDYKFISANEVDNVLASDLGDLIGKPCLCSSGGGGVERYTYSGAGYFRHDGTKVSSRFISKLGYSSYIVQKKIEQAAFPASFNPPSV
ncbi:MAG TPA: hypothetical protein PK147_10760, partial [Saprospiraceae bacterium]|nr:hypothetical protein [Saprospiraceae bacterium]